MDAENRKITGREFLEQTSIEELHRTTKISYSSLEQLKSGEFGKMPRVKFFGFIRLMQSYYPEVDFSDLIEEYQAANPHREELPDLTHQQPEEPPIEEGKSLYLWIGGVAVGVLVLYFLFQRGEESRVITAPPPPTQKPKVVKLDYNVTQFIPPPTNLSTGNLSSNLSAPLSSNQSEQNGTVEEQNRSESTQSPPSKPRKVVIWPVKRVWVQAKNRETGKVVAGVFTPENPLRLGEGNFSIKTGNEFFVLQVGDRNLSRQLFKGGVNRIQIEGSTITINGKVVTE